MSVIITLTLGEISVATSIAAMRVGSNRQSGVDDAYIGPGSKRFASEFNGACAEIAFCKYRNLYPDLTVGPRSGGVDCVGRSGETVDVKCTDRSDGNLLVRIDKAASPCDYYALSVVRGPGEVEIIGYASADEVFRDENLKDVGHGPTYFIKQSQLHPLGGGV